MSTSLKYHNYVSIQLWLQHHFDIILMLHTNTHGYEYIMNFKMWSFWCHLKQTLSTSLKYHIDVSIQLWLWTSSWHHFDDTYQYYRIWIQNEHQNVIILMSLITAIVNVTEISYWCLYLAVITNIPSTSFWCYIPKLAYISALDTSKCDHFDVSSQLTVTKTSFWCLYSTVHINVTKTSKWYHNRIVIVRLQKFDLMHHLDIILM